MPLEWRGAAPKEHLVLLFVSFVAVETVALALAVTLILNENSDAS